MHSILLDLIIFSSAAVIAVPIFRKLKLGAILAYLFAGIVIGPYVTGLIKEAEVILHFSELGVVFLLFLIGLELAPARLWKMRYSIFGLGALQVILTGLVLCGIGLLLGWPLSTSYIAGFGLALSSTAFVMQILEERNDLSTTYGQGSFSILMFQDLAVVPILASLALFTTDSSSALGFWEVARAFAVIGVLIFAGRYLIRYALNLVADRRTQEVFTAMALLIVLGTAVLMESIGLSMGMGAFFAGVLLANSEYRHELEKDLLPFKGLLLGLFFIAVGMSLNIDVLIAQWVTVLVATFGLMLLKGTVIYTLGRIFKYPSTSAQRMATILPQGGEFAFVIFSAALAKNLMPLETISILNAAVILSMSLTPLIFSLNEKWLNKKSGEEIKEFDQIDESETEVIIAGFGRFGQIVSRFLKAEDIRYTILEHSADQVETARKFGNKVYYGDASHLETLISAGAKHAKILVLAIDDVEVSTKTAKLVKKNFPDIEVIARVRNRQHALDLIEMGIENVHRETYLTSLEVAKEVLLHRGQIRDQINKRLALFRKKDEKILREQLVYRHDEKKFISYTHQANEELQNILKADIEDQANQENS